MTKNQKTAIIPGTFDPITYGHLEIICLSATLFDNIIIAIGNNIDKKTMFSAQNRQEFIDLAMEQTNFNNYSIIQYSGFLQNFADKNNADVIIRGVRNSSDLEFEQKIDYYNSKITSDSKKIPTLLAPSNQNNRYISSNAVREIIEFSKKDSTFDLYSALKDLVPAVVLQSNAFKEMSNND